MTDGTVREFKRELRLTGMCPKCGSFPQPQWYVVKSGGSFKKEGEAEEQLKEVIIKEHLWYRCPCGYSWEGPTMDQEKGK